MKLESISVVSSAADIVGAPVAPREPVSIRDIPERLRPDFIKAVERHGMLDHVRSRLLGVPERADGSHERHYFVPRGVSIPLTSYTI